MQTRLLVWLLILGSVSSMWAGDGAANYLLQLKHEFFPGGGNPENPSGELLEISDGEFIGTSMFGGDNGKGTVFKISSNNVVEVLHSFLGMDGERPTGGVVSDGKGFFYGVTGEGGSNLVHGTIFRISLNGQFQSLISFAGTNGSQPLRRLLLASDGAFYGCTLDGGAHNLGTVFRFMTNGMLESIHSFDRTNGCNPISSLVEVEEGLFYGTAERGGNGFTGMNGGHGVAFSITTNGEFEVRYAFSGSDGSQPTAPLCLASDGALYGTTYLGGAHGPGTVFRLRLSGDFQSLYSFHPEQSGVVYAGLTEGRDGHLYGTTIYSFDGPAITNGTIFRISKSGVHQTLFKLDGPSYRNPFNDLTLGRDGNLYATLGDANWQSSSSGNFGTFIKLLTLPTITSVVPTNGGFVIEWDSIPGQFYEVYHHSVLGTPETWVGMRSMWATGMVSSLVVPDFYQPYGFYKVGLFDEPVPPWYGSSQPAAALVQ